MRFIVDLQLPPRLCRFIRATGHGCDYAAARGLTSDPDIWRAAIAEGAVVVSKDWDFVELHRNPGGARLLWIRTGNGGAADLIARLTPPWPLIVRAFERGQTLVEVS